MSHGVKVTRNVETPMRDGTVLRANLFRPEAEGRYPVLLCRTPYNKDGSSWAATALRYASEGYVVLIQDCRGRFSSDGVFYPMLNEMEDGYDSVEWAAAQPWAAGKVGMFGASYVGATQWLAAAAAPPHLAAIVPGVTGCDYHDGWFYQGGAFLLGFVLNWTLGSLATATVQRLSVPEARREEIADAVADMLEHAGRTATRLPLTDVAPIGEEGLAPYYLDWLAHPAYDEFWARWDIAAHHGRITAPALSMGGWYDYFLNGTLRNYTGMKAGGGSEAARTQRLIVGPWAHNIPLFGPNQGELSFGPRSLGTAIDLDGMALRWFDHWLKGIDDGMMSEPPVKLFTVGANRWQSYAGWPVPGTRYVTYHLRGGGAANSAAGDGRLGLDPPGDEPPDTYLYDPRRPVPTRGGGTGRGGIYDQRSVEAREDVLVYTSEPLSEDTEVTGPIVVKLWASSSAPDTDFAAKLVDVAPGGLAVNLADNLIRARYRNSHAKAELLEPGKPYELTIDLFGASNLFKKGHRIRVEVASSNFPRFDRNPNTGAPFASDAKTVPALQTVFHDAQRPSAILLPVIPR